jgi:hypothetical protein
VDGGATMTSVAQTTRTVRVQLTAVAGFSTARARTVSSPESMTRASMWMRPSPPRISAPTPCTREPAGHDSSISRGEVELAAPSVKNENPPVRPQITYAVTCQNRSTGAGARPVAV